MGWTEREFEEENSIEFIRKLAIKLTADSKSAKDSTPSDIKKPRLTR